MRYAVLLAVLWSGCAAQQAREARAERISCLDRRIQQLRDAMTLADDFHVSIGTEGDCWDEYKMQKAVDDPTWQKTAQRCLAWRRFNDEQQWKMKRADDEAEVTRQECIAAGERANAAEAQAAAQSEAIRAAGESLAQGYRDSAATLAGQPSTSTNCTSTVYGNTVQTHCY